MFMCFSYTPLFITYAVFEVNICTHTDNAVTQTRACEPARCNDRVSCLVILQSTSISLATTEMHAHARARRRHSLEPGVPEKYTHRQTPLLCNGVSSVANAAALLVPILCVMSTACGHSNYDYYT